MTSAAGWRPKFDEWRPRLRWFAAEFLVVVAGILTALWLQSSWQEREDASREVAYLRQLAADLNETLDRVALADSLHRESESAQTQLLFAFQRPEPPPLDSITLWLWGTIQRGPSPVPVMGTIDALVSTGDLRLIRDDSIRTAIVAYASSTRSASEEEAKTTDQTVFVLKHEMAERVDFAELEARYYPRSVLDSLVQEGELVQSLPGDRLSRFPLNRDTLLNDRALYTAVSELTRAKHNLRQIRREMRAEAEALLAKIDSYRPR